MSHFRTKHCACGCGRVGEFAQYATNACRQRAYRRRKADYRDVKARSVSEWLIEQFGEDDCASIFGYLNEVKGDKNIRCINGALEQVVYLIEAKVRKETAKARRIK